MSAKRLLSHFWNGFAFALWVAVVCVMFGVTVVWAVACYFCLTGGHFGWGVFCVLGGLIVMGEGYSDIWSARPALVGGEG